MLTMGGARTWARARGGTNYNLIFDGLSAGPVALLELSKAL
jgi:hypothetical protein